MLLPFRPPGGWFISGTWVPSLTSFTFCSLPPGLFPISWRDDNSPLAVTTSTNLYPYFTASRRFSPLTDEVLRLVRFSVRLVFACHFDQLLIVLSADAWYYYSRRKSIFISFVSDESVCLALRGYCTPVPTGRTFDIRPYVGSKESLVPGGYISAQ